MNKIVEGLEGVTVYLDDTIVVSDSWPEHLCHLLHLLDRLTQANLTINLAKCKSCQTAFDAVKALLTSAPVLMAPRLGKPFKIMVDASKEGAVAVLVQEDDAGIERPVCFFSRKCNNYQRNYSTIGKEALALIWAL